MDSFGDGADTKSEKTLHSDATADDLSILGSGDSGPVNGVMPADGLATEIVTTTMTRDDERFLEKLKELKPSLALATKWLRLLSVHNLPDDEFDVLIETVPKGVKLSSAALLAYIRSITQGKNVSAKLSLLLDDTKQAVQNVALLPFTIDQIESEVMREAGIGES